PSAPRNSDQDRIFENRSSWKHFAETRCKSRQPFQNGRLAGSRLITCSTYKEYSMTDDTTSLSVDLSGAVEIRQNHIKHEASVRSVGLLYYLGAFFMCLIGIVGVATHFSATESTAPNSLLINVLLILVGFLQAWVGSGIRHLKSWSRLPAGILSGIGLLGFPIGTLINAYILFLLFSKRGTTVFSQEYQQIIAITPSIKYRTSVVVWIFLVLLILLIMLAFVLPLLNR
ncbi:MAG TPA: hypothetical protein PKE12_05600, partial [Kiritimatiellia bacterium]|nr:hypothetical protein [Kiritimatiellia bacterium]